jgi:hypothetical protein
MLKLQNRVKDLEKEKSEMQKERENSEEDAQKDPTSKEVISDSAFNALKVIITSLCVLSCTCSI